MQIQIRDSVGKSGKNNPDDVVKVQHLLLQLGFAIGPSDGQCGPRTIAGITEFQACFLPQADGLVEPTGETLQRLNMVGFPINTDKKAPIMVPPKGTGQTIPGEVRDPITRLVPRDSLGPLNPRLTCTDNTFMISKFGKPRASMSTDCQPVTNASLKNQIVTESVGPFRATGLELAVESLRAVMQDISTKQPEIYTALGTAGMLCCRYVRGSTSSISNHSWGTAIDLTLHGLLDKRGDGLVQHGLAVIAPIFNNHGWYWGAAFKTEDAMHFEVSREALEKWFPG
jgi:peptidoglycan hydrolase-like protein with peptidoglycan-binding domain